MKYIRYITLYNWASSFTQATYGKMKPETDDPLQKVLKKHLDGVIRGSIYNYIYI
jgi:hypothetical protein